jgi:DNA-binding LacI/PurR family transcriptional regulator
VLTGNYGGVRISDATRERILRACEERGYEPNIHASRLFSKRAGTIALLMPPGLTRLDDDNLSRFANAVYREFEHEDYRMLILVANERFLSRREHISIFRRKEVDAAIGWGMIGDLKWLDEMRRQNEAIMLASNRVESYPCVSCDDDKGMRAMAERCLGRGARKFIYVNGTACEVALRRESAFRSAVSGHEYQVLPGDFSVAAGQNAIKGITAFKPDAVVCASDKIAVGVLLGLRKAGIRVPEDMLVTGADNIELSEYSHPPLTTYDQMATECGRRCARSLLSLLKDCAPLTSSVVAPALHFRESA